jgi:hypothetical protein
MRSDKATVNDTIFLVMYIIPERRYINNVSLDDVILRQKYYLYLSVIETMNANEVKTLNCGSEGE